MNKLSVFFKSHPLLALFLTSVITISFINMAISLQSKRFKPVTENDSNAWNFSETASTAPEELPSPAGGKDRSSLFRTADLEVSVRNGGPAWPDGGDAPSDGLFFENVSDESTGAELTESAVEPAENTDTAEITETAANETEAFEFPGAEENVGEEISLVSETSAADDAVDFFADVDENTDAAAAADETISDQFAAEEDRVDFFADLPDESVAPVQEETDDFGDAVAENIPEEPESAPQETEEVRTAQDEAKVDPLDEIAVSDSKELSAPELTWISTDLTESGPKTDDVSSGVSGDLGWELVDGSEAVSDEAEVYESQEPDKTKVADNYDSSAKSAEESADAAAPAEPAAETAADAQTEVAAETAAEPEAAVSTEPSESETAEIASDAPAEDNAAETADAEPAPAAARQCPCVRRPACTGTAPAAAAAPSTAAEPLETAAAAAPQPAEIAETAPEPAAAKTPAVRGTEVWAISTENLSGYAVQPSRLLCWRAEAGQFIASSVDEYKEALTADVPTVIMIHGNMTDWNGALRHAQSLKTRIDQMRARQKIETPYRLVIWKWASERQDQRIRSDSQYKAYLADLNGFYLASFLSAINGTGSDITILGFSFGARTIGCAVELMAGGSVYGRTLPEEQRYVAGDRYHAILLAGACNYGDFSTKGQYAHGGDLISSMINVFNPADNALAFYPLLYGPAGPQAIGVAPVDPNTASAAYKDRLWSINSSGYGAQHNFDNLLYSICDPLLGNIIYAGKIWSAADAIPSVSDGVVDPVVKEKSDAEAAQAEEGKIVAENQ